MLARYLFNDVFRRRREPSGRWPPRFRRIFLSKLRCRTLGGTIRRIVACCGIGNQFGNYEMRAAGETRDAVGDHCTIFDWDRPLNRNYGIRYTSQSCESKEHPAWQSATTYARSVIPISQSYLATAAADVSK